jgi:hypothetical protein
MATAREGTSEAIVERSVVMHDRKSGVYVAANDVRQYPSGDHPARRCIAEIDAEADIEQEPVRSGVDQRR